MDNINWELCCLCQSDTDEQLQTPREEGLLSLDIVMNAFKEMNACIAVTSDQLNDGSGIAATLRLHQTKYHKLAGLTLEVLVSSGFVKNKNKQR